MSIVSLRKLKEEPVTTESLQMAVLMYLKSMMNTDYAGAYIDLACEVRGSYYDTFQTFYKSRYSLFK